MRTQNILTAFVLGLLTGANCAAQADAKGHVSVGRTDRLDWRGLDEIASHIDPGKLGPISAGTWEAQNLDATLRAARQAFSIDLGLPGGLYTADSGAGDVLVAEWQNADPARRDRAVWLWDDPRAITFVFVGDSSMLDPAYLASFCERAIRWQDGGGAVKGLELGFLPSGGVVGKAEYPANEIGALAWWLYAVSAKGVSYLAIGMTKAMFYGQYPLGTMRVSERFPPLASRLKTLPRPELFGELGKGYKKPFMITYPDLRDQIVLGELASRGALSELEISRIVLGGSGAAPVPLDTTVHPRLQSLLDTLSRAGQLSRYVPELEACFLSPAGAGLRGDHAGSLLGGLRRAGVDATGTALRLLRRQEYARVCLYTLKMDGHDEETLRSLVDAPVPSSLTQEKAAAVDAIRRRVAAAR